MNYDFSYQNKYVIDFVRLFCKFKKVNLSAYYTRSHWHKEFDWLFRLDSSLKKSLIYLVWDYDGEWTE